MISFPKRPIAVAIGIPSAACFVPCAYCDQIDDDFKRLDGTSRLFALTEGNTAAYRLNSLHGKAASPLGNNLDIFERAFPMLKKDEQVDLALLILVNYDFDGEYSIRFRVMIEASKPFISERLTRISKDRLEEFVRQYGGKFGDFAEECKRFLGVTL